MATAFGRRSPGSGRFDVRFGLERSGARTGIGAPVEQQPHEAGIAFGELAMQTALEFGGGPPGGEEFLTRPARAIVELAFHGLCLLLGWGQD